MPKWTYSILRWLLSCLIFLGCTHKKNNSENIEDTREKQAIFINQLLPRLQKYVQNGDIVTRTGNDFTSHSIRSLNRRNTDFSHIGIASIENDSLFIYHALGGDFNPDQKILRQPFLQFVNPLENKAMGIFRFSIPGKKNDSLLARAKRYFLQEIKFDMEFDLSTDDRLYCAEFVAKSIAPDLPASTPFQVSNIGTFRFYGVDDITLHPYIKKIYDVWYFNKK